MENGKKHKGNLSAATGTSYDANWSLHGAYLDSIPF
jgi:hypothetical protein